MTKPPKGIVCAKLCGSGERRPGSVNADAVAGDDEADPATQDEETADSEEELQTRESGAGGSSFWARWWRPRRVWCSTMHMGRVKAPCPAAPTSAGKCAFARKVT